MQQGHILPHQFIVVCFIATQNLVWSNLIGRLGRVIVITETVRIYVVCLGESMCHTQITVITFDQRQSSVVPLKKVSKILNVVQKCPHRC